MSSLIRAVPLNPFLTGPLWLLLTRAPEQIRAPILQWLREHVSAEAIRNAITALKWLFAIGLTTRAHSLLTDLAQNNWRLRSERHRYHWPDERAVVTGAAGGFGSLISKGLASHGIEVIALDVAEQLPADMQSIRKIHYYRCDITDRQAVMDLAAKVRKEHGEARILVNNAGVAFDSEVIEASERDVRKIFDVNIISHYWTLAAWLPGMLSAKKGHVVSVASMASFVTLPNMVSYANTKAAVMSLHEGLQSEARMLHKAPEVKFTCVHPNFAATAMTKPYEDEIKRLGSPLMKPEVVSEAVVKQILSCRGRQIVLPDSMSFVSTQRAWPSYLSYLVSWTLERPRLGAPHGGSK